MSDLELVCLEVELLKSRPFIVIAWYRPPISSVDLFAELESALSFFDNESKDVIIYGVPLPPKFRPCYSLKRYPAF